MQRVTDPANLTEHWTSRNEKVDSTNEEDIESDAYGEDEEVIPIKQEKELLKDDKLPEGLPKDDEEEAI